MRLIPGIIRLSRSSPTFFNPHPDVVETLAFWRCAVKQRPASEPPERNRRSSESPIQQFWLLVFFRKDLRGQPESSACHQVSTSPVEYLTPPLSKNSRAFMHPTRGFGLSLLPADCYVTSLSSVGNPNNQRFRRRLPRDIAPTLPQLGNLHHRAEYRCPSIHSLKNKSWWSTRLSADFHRLWSSHL